MYTYAGDDGYQCRYEHHDLISAAGFGGMMWDSYAGMEIKDGTLTVSDYGGSSIRWANDYVFGMKGEDIVLKEHDEYVGSMLSGDGMRSIWSFEKGTFETYANTLLINKGTYEAKTILFEEVDLSELQGIVTIEELPYLSYHEGYKGLQDDAGNKLTYDSLNIISATHDIGYHGIDYSHRSYKVHD